MTMHARINFGRIKGFPQLTESNKIETTLFLDACREIVQLIGKHNSRISCFEIHFVKSFYLRFFWNNLRSGCVRCEWQH